MSSEAGGDAGPANNGAKCTAFAGPNPRITSQVEPDNCIKVRTCCCSPCCDGSSPCFPPSHQILLATDNHIGYGETDPVRGRDSINTFREILQLAVENDVCLEEGRGGEAS